MNQSTTKTTTMTAMPKNMMISIIVGAVVIAGGFFYGGMKYQQSISPVLMRGAGAFAGGAAGRTGRGGPGGTAGAGFTTGQILSSDATGITIQLRTGGSQIIFVSPSTTVMKAVSGTASDLTVGQQVTITGSSNPDGSINAQSIQVRPPMPSPSASPSTTN